jgi:Zn-dependent protease with chaperone function
MLLFAIGFERSLDRRISAAFWLVAAGMNTLIGSACLRSAQGFKKRRVKSGTLYVRTIQLARRMGVAIGWIYVVPPGRGDLTNAFASLRSISLTDNFGEYLHGPQLDSVIAHELAHHKNKHLQKRLAFVLLSVFTLSIIAFGFAPLIAGHKPIVIWVSLLAFLLSYNGISRRFEYEADRDAALLTGNPEAEIRSLTALYRKTNSPVETSRFLELFMTHPALPNRISAIARAAGLSSDRAMAIISKAGLSDDVLLPTH